MDLALSQSKLFYLYVILHGHTLNHLSVFYVLSNSKWITKLHTNVYIALGTSSLEVKLRANFPKLFLLCTMTGNILASTDQS